MAKRQSINIFIDKMFVVSIKCFIFATVFRQNKTGHKNNQKIKDYECSTSRGESKKQIPK